MDAKLKSKTRVSLTFLSASLLPLMAAAQGPGYWGYGDGPGPWHMWAWGWGFGWIFPLLFFFLMIALCVIAARSHWGHGMSAHHTSSSALQILSERFAKGEISKEEFEEKRAILARRS